MSRKHFLLLLLVLTIAGATADFIFLKTSATKPETAPKIVETRKSRPEYIKIMFAGDLMFDRGIRYYASQNKGNDFIFKEIADLLKENDLNVVNLEGSITDYKSVSAGTPAGSANNYYLTFDSSVAKTLFDQNIKMVDLGNNHILNFGKEGLAQTKKYLDEAGIDYFGSPDNPRGATTEIGGLKITFISYNEFSNLKKEPEQKATLEEIKKAKEFSDIIIVFSHWGAEYSKIPEKSDIILAHQFVDAGAGFVVGSHPHVTQITEIYKGKRIYYSLGNFIFDQYFDEDVRNGMGVVLKINTKTKEIEFSDKNFYLDHSGQTILLSPLLSAKQQ